MKKTLLSMAAALFALAANADGIDAVGANIEILPSTKHGSTVEARQWKAWVYAINTGTRFDSNGQGNGSENENYNVVWGTPDDDSNSKKWYEVGYSMEDVTGVNSTTGDEITWEEVNAPFTSNGDGYNGATKTYNWLDSEIMGEIYIRRTFTTDRLLAGDVYLACGHDDAPSEYYLNGVLIKSFSDGWDESAVYKLTDEQKALIIRDGVTENVLAVHVHQNWGGAFADCGLYTLVPGGVEMGYVNSWTGKTIFNSCGGYQFNGQSSFVVNANHGWEKLYEAKEGDVYTIHITQEDSGDDWQSQVHFKTPINIDATHEYEFKTTIASTSEDNTVTVKLCEMNNDEIVLNEESVEVSGDEPDDYSVTFTGTDVANFKVVFNFAWVSANTDVKLSNMSLVDKTTGKELWVGTHYFNFMYFSRDSKHVKDPVIDGRTETLAWTMPEFDDSEWDDTAMPVGNLDYMSEVKTEWPAGINNNADMSGNTADNTGYWIRRTFTLDEINPRLSYALNVCHDDDYKTYVNGVLLQENTGWTNGKNPVQVHIPAKILRAGKNVIATEIHQNWGGRFYDCGINVEEVDYDACVQLVKDAIALATTDKDLTQAMKDSLQVLVDAANDEIANNKDAAELKEYAKNLTSAINGVLSCSDNVSTLRQTIAICKGIKDNGYLADKLNAATEGIEACKTNDAVNRLLNDLRNARRRNAAERHTEKFVGSQPQADGMYYLYNVGEKQFLAGGENWGAHMALAYSSNAMKLVNTTRIQTNSETDETTGGTVIEGGYRIESFRPNGTLGTDDFLNWGGYVDCNTDDAWQFVPVEGKTNVFNIARLNCQDLNEKGEPYLLGWRGGVNAERENGYDNNNGYSYNVIDTDMNSKEIESNQWMLITKEELDAFATTATADAPADMTHLISNPGFDQRLDISSWVDDCEGGHWGIYGRNDNHQDFTYEGYDTDKFNLSQEIYDEAIIPGWYTLSVQGYYREGSYVEAAAKIAAGEELAANANLYVDDKTTPLVTIAEGVNAVPGLGRLDDATKTVRFPDSTFDAAEHYFSNGYYKNEIKFEVTEDNAGYILFGVSKDADVAEDWVVVDNFRLKYWGKSEPTAIETVDNTATESAKAIYNLQGQKLVKAVKGVNIINGRKVVVK